MTLFKRLEFVAEDVGQNQRVPPLQRTAEYFFDYLDTHDVIAEINVQMGPAIGSQMFITVAGPNLLQFVVMNYPATYGPQGRFKTTPRQSTQAGNLLKSYRG